MKLPIIIKKNDPAALEQMCGILMITMQETNDEKLLREFTSILSRIKCCEPLSGFDIKRLDKCIIYKLREIHDLLRKKGPREKILGLCAEIGLVLLEREQKVERLSKPNS